DLIPDADLLCVRHRHALSEQRRWNSAPPGSPRAASGRRSKRAAARCRQAPASRPSEARSRARARQRKGSWPDATLLVFAWRGTPPGPGASRRAYGNRRTEAANGKEDSTFPAVWRVARDVSHRCRLSQGGLFTDIAAPMSRKFSLPTIAATAVFFVLCHPAFAADLVISQVYGGGGNAGAQLKNDFIEVFNRGSAPIPLGGMSVQYASTTGN